MVSNLTLPTPDPTSDVWGEELNAAIEAVNTDVETNKSAVASNTNAIAGVQTTLGSKADSAAVTLALAQKANTSDLAGKADTTVVNSQIAALDAEVDTKADGPATTASLNSLTSSLAAKASTAYVDAELANKADVSDVPPPSLFLKEGELVPVGTETKTVIYRTPPQPEDIKVTHVSNNQGTNITQFELPDDLRVGDVLLAIATTMGAGRSFTWAAPWTEIFDYSQNRTSSAAIYRISNQAALDDVVTPVITPVGNFDRMVLAILKIPAQVATAWPAYGSGNGRSAATLTSPTTTSFGLGSIATSPFTSFDTEWYFAVAYSGIVSGPAPTISSPAGFTTVIDATTGGLRFKMGRRKTTVLPVPAITFNIGHVAGFTNALYGGAHFITPTKEA